MRRALLRGIGHIGMLNDARVYRLLRDWIDAAARAVPLEQSGA